ncbi:MAG: hypothetical protein HWE10_10365 [Gammaproteobacteria bacterium]|nr:hypothetical protein [Gammaproteobacteria bacterium]
MTRCNLALLTSIFIISLISTKTSATTVNVKDEQGNALHKVMVMQTPIEVYQLDKSDQGYVPERTKAYIDQVTTLFTDQQGQVVFSDYKNKPVRIRLRAPEMQDVTVETTGGKTIELVMKPITDPLKLAESRPANTWLSALNFGADEEAADLKKHYILQCGFCHQQGSYFFRRPRAQENWQEIMNRMIGYGARIHDDAQKVLPELLANEYRTLYENPELVPKGTNWSPVLQNAEITSWPIGDAFSQMHDLLYHSNGLVYVGDNLQDRMYEINPKTGEFTLYKLKRESYDEHGGLMGARLASFPKHETYAGIHSFAESPKDGNIFITTSYQQRLVEFNPRTKEFTNHHMDAGYYPHTIRVDKQDRVWFTMALSNQIAMFDRKKETFELFDLPARNIQESFTISFMGIILKLMEWGLPIANWVSIDEQSSGLPMPYGIDITPNGDIWFARLLADSIGKIDAKTKQVTVYDTSFKGPRRLRTDSKGNLWIAAFPESMIVKFDPVSETFTNYPIPVYPLGSESPYSLNVDTKRDIVWINGNTSDALYSYEIDADKWTHYPMPKRVTFTRDVEIAPNGDVYTTNSSFPSWHIEDAQPTLIRLKPSY